MITPCGHVAIDANVFEHLLGPENACGHITTLLRALAKNKASLVVDDKKRIEGEYKKRLLKRIKSGSPRESGKRPGKAADKVRETSLLKLWVMRTVPGAIPRVCVAVSHGDSLMGQIKGKLRRPKKGEPNTDRIFVYVALRQGCPLISNDARDIIKKRDALLEIKGAKKGADILTSKEAAARV